MIRWHSKKFRPIKPLWYFIIENGFRSEIYIWKSVRPFPGVLVKFEEPARAVNEF